MDCKISPTALVWAFLPVLLLALAFPVAAQEQPPGEKLFKEKVCNVRFNYAECSLI